jgi:hypothetical protein
MIWTMEGATTFPSSCLPVTKPSQTSVEVLYLVRSSRTVTDANRFADKST